MDGIVLLAKTPGPTSFNSLNNVKKALNTKKVGHTGTLDSFAQGLLVVCTGRMTRLAGNITEFDKSYKAVIKFGTETDTLEYTGEIVKQSGLPSKEDVIRAVKSFEGKQKQIPPMFSSIKVDGKRLSDIARKGKDAEIPEREITVYKADLIEMKLTTDDKVTACAVDFSVSKGTYIRSLARDIGLACNSCAHLSGLYRTKVGHFSVEEAAGYSLLKTFNIESCLKIENDFLENKKNIILNNENNIEEKKLHKPYIPTPEDILVKKEIVKKIKDFTEETSLLCGFVTVHLLGEAEVNDFLHGKPLRKKMFNEFIDNINKESCISVFSNEKKFCGLISFEGNKLIYKFVNN